MAQVLGGNAEARARKDLRLRPGSGSDFTPFLQHAGVPTLNVGFGGEDGGGIYHSIYDTFAWYTRFSDTSFVYGRALAQLAGTMVMRVANADVLPAEFGSLTETTRRYLAEVTTLRETTAKAIEELNRQLAEGAFTVTNDRAACWCLVQSPHPTNFAPVQNAVDSLARSAERYEKAYGAFRQQRQCRGAGAGERLLRQETRPAHSRGLPRRLVPHSLYAPGCTRLRREDHAGGARGHRAEGLEAGRGAGRQARRRAAAGGRPHLAGREAAGAGDDDQAHPVTRSTP
jgi:N-acetylated-alpha-linked acidic dipeptidase